MEQPQQQQAPWQEHPGGHEQRHTGFHLLKAILRVVARLLYNRVTRKVVEEVSDDEGCTGAEALASALRVNATRPPVLTKLNLANNAIGPQGAKAIGKALEVNEVLTHIDVGANQIREQGAAAIAEALRGNAVLTTLVLSYNGTCRQVEEAAQSGDQSPPIGTASCA